MPELPRGTVAFLFTDLAGSTRLWQRHRSAMEAADVRHDAIVRGAVAAHRGMVYQVVGHAFQAAFPSAPAAVAAALDAQFGLGLEPWPTPEPMRVRMAVHAGDVDPDPDGDYRSPVLNRLGRLLGVAHGGQVLLSGTARRLAHERLPDDAGLLDLGEHRLTDLLEPEHLYQLVHPSLASDFPPPLTLDFRRHNLPVQPTPFLGRERVVARVVEALRDAAVRLLTLTGPGGTGKTRLALQAAAEVVDDYPDGVWFVPLAPVTDPGLVPAAIAAVLGVREEGGRSLPAAIVGSLESKRLLLVLDNVEQVVEAAPLVADLVRGCPELKVLVTSRVRLRVSAEQEQPVPPLGLEDRALGASGVDTAGPEAAQLFAARARAVQPDFALTPDNALVVADICRRLDGLPLAIELAAARVKVLPPQAMLAWLEQRLPLLTGGGRDLPARHQTMQATIAWSYDLLPRPEQDLFRRLAAFVGGFDLEAAVAVAGTPGDQDIDVLDGLSALVDQSLLRLTEGAEGTPRYAMLETVREFAAEQLGASGDAEAVRDRHGAWFLGLAEQAAVRPRWGWWGETESASTERLDRDHTNLRAALAWFSARGDAERGLRLATTLRDVFGIHGHAGERRGWLERVLALPGDASTSSAHRAEALLDLAWTSFELADPEATVAAGERALELFRALGDAQGIARGLVVLGCAAGEEGDLDRAERLHEEAREVARAGGDPGGGEFVLNDLGVIASLRGDDDRATELYEEALRRAREAGRGRMIAGVLDNLATLALAQGDPRRAAHLGQEVRAVEQRLRMPATVEGSVGLAAAVAGAAGMAARAARLMGAAEVMREHAGTRIGSSNQVLYERDLAAARRGLSEETFATAWATGRTLSLEEALAEADAVFAAVIAGDIAHAQPAPAHGLSPRELEVVALLAAGRSNQEIADALFISHRTATTHVRNILTKLDLPSRTAVAAWAIRHGLA